MPGQFKQRLLFGSLGVLSLIISIYYSYHSFFKPIFVFLNAGIVSLALIEYYDLTRNKGFQPLVKFSLISSFCYFIALFFSLHHPSLATLPSLTLLASFLVLFLLFFKRQSFPLGNLAITLFGIAYLTIPLSYALRINYFFPLHAIEDGRIYLAYVLFVTKMTDIGAYFSGKLFGKTKLAPSISPKKTIEGSFGGTISGLITSIIFASLASHFAIFKITFIQSLWMGIILSILAQLGDLAESLLKRDAGVKDSSRLPGLGGFLDIVDSLVFSLPLMYLFLQMQSSS